MRVMELVQRRVVVGVQRSVQDRVVEVHGRGRREVFEAVEKGAARARERLLRECGERVVPVPRSLSREGYGRVRWAKVGARVEGAHGGGTRENANYPRQK